jgi:hypothetical protein
VLLVAALLAAGSAAAGEADRFLGRISPTEDRVALTRALARVIGAVPYCLGIAAQGSNVLLSHSRREPESESGIVFPTLVDSTTPGRLRVELEALTHAGLIELATIDGFETYRLTSLGRESYDIARRDFCTKGVEFAEFIDLSEQPPKPAAISAIPAQQVAEVEPDGATGSRLYATYRFRVVDPPRWMRDAGLKRIYPSLRTLNGAVAVAMLQEAKDGWYLVAISPAVL